jgi:hypothetical protein
MHEAPKDPTLVEATHLVVSCIDHRCTDDLQSVMSQIVSPSCPDPFAWNRWDHVALPGASLGVVQSVFPSWREAFASQLSIALDLHKHIHTIVVVDHLECGAYKRLHAGYANDQEAAHRRFTEEFRRFILALRPSMVVQRYLLEPCKLHNPTADPLNWQARDLDSNRIFECVDHARKSP